VKTFSTFSQTFRHHEKEEKVYVMRKLLNQNDSAQMKFTSQESEK